MSVVDTAQSLVGQVSYKFGADNIPGGKGDCSSFTQYVFSQNGVEIGRNTASQWTKGQAVNQSDLQSGDLVFFRNTYNSGYKDGVSHVGIYIGNGQFVHNSSDAGGTTVSNLSDSYYQKHYLGARRINAETVGNTPEDESWLDKFNVKENIEEVVTDIAAGVLKAVVIMVLLVLAFLCLTNGFGFKIGG